MKKLLLIPLTALTLLAVTPNPTPPTPVDFYWNNQSAQNVDYRVYYTTNVALPMSQWPLFILITNPIVSADLKTLSYTNAPPLPPAVYFFTMTGSNFWSGEVPFSAAVATGPSPVFDPVPVSSLAIKPHGH